MNGEDEMREENPENVIRKALKEIFVQQLTHTILQTQDTML
jgi:hypothetical protein